MQSAEQLPERATTTRFAQQTTRAAKDTDAIARIEVDRVPKKFLSTIKSTLQVPSANEIESFQKRQSPSGATQQLHVQTNFSSKASNLVNAKSPTLHVQRVQKTLKSSKPIEDKTSQQRIGNPVVLRNMDAHRQNMGSA